MQADSVNLCMLTPNQKELELVSENGVSLADARGDAPVFDAQTVMGLADKIKCVAPEVGDICANPGLQNANNFLSTPLYQGGQIIGAICVTRAKQQPFTEIENHTLKLLANSAAVAIANIRLAEDSRRQTELNATLNERQRLTSELHDEAAQTLSLLNLKVGELECEATDKISTTRAMEWGQFKRLIEKAQAQMRMAFSGLNSRTLPRQNDLAKELTQYVEEFRSTTGLTVDLIVTDLSTMVLPPLIQKQAMYIYREALTNVRRYANAKTVQVRLAYTMEQGLQMLVSDDGRGFDPHAAASDHHLGLAVMHARIERVGGTLNIETAPGAGTSVVAYIPTQAMTAKPLSVMEAG
jgi:signal transduction histidine kinase